jgi:hypothetical protein
VYTFIDVFFTFPTLLVAFNEIEEVKVGKPFGKPTDEMKHNFTSRPTLGLNQPPIKWAPGFFPRRQSDRGVKLTTYRHLVPRLKMCGAIPPLSHTSAWHGAQISMYQEQLLLFTFTFTYRPKEVDLRMRTASGS